MAGDLQKRSYDNRQFTVALHRLLRDGEALTGTPAITAESGSLLSISEITRHDTSVSFWVSAGMSGTYDITIRAEIAGDTPQQIEAVVTMEVLE